MIRTRGRKSLFFKRFANIQMRGTFLPVVLSFAAGVAVTIILTGKRRSYDYVPGRGGRNEAQHWRPDGGADILDSPGIFGRLLGREEHHHEKEFGDIGEPVGYQRDHVHEGSDTVAEELSKKVRVLCWVMTQPANHIKMAPHVKATWGKRCNILLFMSTSYDPNLPTVNLNISEGRNELWNKTREAFKYVYKNYYDQADWFMKADDDTYVVVENLRYMLKDTPPEDPVWFGCNFKKFNPQGYMSGGAGYVLSKEALRRFVEVAMPDKSLCRHDGHGAEDAEIGACLNNVNVTAGDSRDEEKRWRFFPFTVDTFVGPDQMGKDFWFWDYIKYPYFHGPDCCSDTAVSFHYVPPGQMYVMDYLVYHLKPYGRGWRTEPPGPDLAKYISSQNSSSDNQLPGVQEKVIDVQKKEEQKGNSSVVNNAGDEVQAKAKR